MILVIDAGYHGVVAWSACSTLPVSASITSSASAAARRDRERRDRAGRSGEYRGPAGDGLAWLHAVIAVRSFSPRERAVPQANCRSPSNPKRPRKAKNRPAVRPRFRKGCQSRLKTSKIWPAGKFGNSDRQERIHERLHRRMGPYAVRKARRRDRRKPDRAGREPARSPMPASRPPTSTRSSSDISTQASRRRILPPRWCCRRRRTCASSAPHAWRTPAPPVPRRCIRD